MIRRPGVGLVPLSSSPLAGPGRKLSAMPSVGSSGGLHVTPSSWDTICRVCQGSSVAFTNWRRSAPLLEKTAVGLRRSKRPNPGKTIAGPDQVVPLSTERESTTSFRGLLSSQAARASANTRRAPDGARTAEGIRKQAYPRDPAMKMGEK